MRVKANGKTFNFPDGTSEADIGNAIDEYFSGEAQPSGNNSPEQHADESSLVGRAGEWLAGGQSAGRILEQTGRGLVNVPFDVLQGGVNLVNAASRGLGGGKVIDDVYRPIDRPTDQYAQTGEAIGGYLIPGVGLGGKMAIGSVAEASNQEGDFAQNAAQNAAVNLGAQGLLSGAAKLVGRGITAATGKIAPDVQKTIIRAENAGVIPMTSDVLPPNNAFTRGLVQGGEGALYGTGALRGEQYAARSRMVENYYNKFGEYNPDEVVRSMTSTLGGRRTVAGDAIQDITQRMGSAPVNISNATTAIDTSIARLERLGTSADPKLLATLKNLKGELSSPDLDFNLFRQHRTAFRSNVQGDAMVFPDQAKAITNMVENAMSRDLRSSVGQVLGPADAAKYIKANSDYHHIYNKALNKQISNKLNRARNEATPELINSVVFSRNASDIKRIWPSLNDTGKDAVRAAYISKIADATDDSPAKFLTQVSKLKKQAGGEVYNIVFGGQQMKELNALYDVLKLTSRADAANVVTQTGQAQANPFRIGTAVATAGLSLIGESGYGTMMRVYESRTARNALLRLANTKAGTPAYERALNQAAVTLRPLLANQITQQE